MGLIGQVFASAPEIDLGGSLSSAAGEVTAQVAAALPVALPIAGALIAITVGWRIFKRFVRG